MLGAVARWVRGLAQRWWLLHTWGSPEPVETMIDVGLVWWGVSLLLPWTGLEQVPALAWLGGYPAEIPLGTTLCLLGCGQQTASLLRWRPWRRALLLLALAWWTFLVVSILVQVGVTPALGSYVPLLGGSWWAQLRVASWERWQDSLRQTVRG